MESMASIAIGMFLEVLDHLVKAQSLVLLTYDLY